MHKNNSGRASSLVILLVASLTLSALAGIQFMAAAAAAGYIENVGTVDGVNYVVRFPDSWNGMLVVVTQAGGATPVVDARTSSFNSTAAVFLSKGYAVAGSNYGGATGYCHTKAVNSTYTITKYIVDTYHITGKVFLYGNSMGGGFALFIGQKYPELYDGVLEVGGGKETKTHYAYYDLLANMTVPELRSYLNAPATMTDAVLQSMKSMFVSFLSYYQNETGGTPQQVPAEYEVRSIINYPNITVPVITIHGSEDPLVPVSQTTNYQAAVAAAGRSSLYRVYIVPYASTTAQVPIRFDELVSWANALDGWTMTVDGRSMKAYPDLKEYVWQKNASIAPNGPYDKIGLHRLVKTGISPKGVIFICPGTYCNGAEQIISNPPTDNFTMTENYSQPMYWANRGFDVYAIDYRTHFVPLTLKPNETAFMANWGYDQWISDTKEAVEKTKEVSGASKIFIAGESFGGSVALYYASKYWQQDLKGIILLDGGTPLKNAAAANTYNLTATLYNMTSSGKIVWEMPNIGTGTTPPSGFLFLYQYALQNPGAPAQYPPGTPLAPSLNPLTNKTWTNMTEYITVLGAPSLVTNIAGGNGNLTAYLHWMSTMDRYSPLRLQYEAAAISGWTNCPYVAYDYDDHYKEINVPLLGFTSELFGKLVWKNVTNGMATGDFTSFLLPNYAHTDVYTGIYSSRDVSQPTLDWMRSELIGFKATAFCSVTVLPGWTWNFFAHSNGAIGSLKYQWYEGITPIAGQTSMVLPVTKTSAGTYTFYCKVTDSEGTTTTSNAVTLTVLG